MARKPKDTIENKAAVKVSQPADSEAFAAPVTDYRSRCGGALRTAREKAGMTVNDVAAQLRLSTKQIEALEADHFDVLPEATIVKGFIRNYAKLLKLNPQPMLDAFIVAVPDQAPKSFTLQPSATMTVSPYQKPNFTRYVALAALVMIVLLVWFFYQSYVQKPSPVTPNTNIMQPKVEEEALPEAALPVGERVSAYSAPANEAQTAGGVDAGVPATAPNPAESYTAPAPAGTPATTPSAPSTPPVSPSPSPATASTTTPATAPVAPTTSTPMQTTLSETPPPAAPVGSIKLEFNASQETWVNVVDANGKEIYSKTLFAGNREIISAKVPLNITVGNALGTTLNVNGKSVDLAPHTRVNVAHIKVE